MFDRRISFVASVALLAAFALGANPARANHTCDPVTDEGWRVVPSHETTDRKDSAPYQMGPSGNWFVDRSTTMLPFCNYYNPIGIYSMRSYSLDPETTTERIAICRATADGRSAPIAPYGGPCPPK